MAFVYTILVTWLVGSPICIGDLFGRVSYPILMTWLVEFHILVDLSGQFLWFIEQYLHMFERLLLLSHPSWPEWSVLVLPYSWMTFWSVSPEGRWLSADCRRLAIDHIRIDRHSSSAFHVHQRVDPPQEGVLFRGRTSDPWAQRCSLCARVTCQVWAGSGFCLRSLDRHGGLDWVLLDFSSGWRI